MTDPGTVEVLTAADAELIQARMAGAWLAAGRAVGARCTRGAGGARAAHAGCAPACRSRPAPAPGGRWL